MKIQRAHLSYSEMRLHGDCRKSWYSNYVLGRRTPPGEAANWGKRFEDVVTAQLRAIVCDAPHKPKREDAKVTPEIVPTNAVQLIAAAKQNDAAEERFQADLHRAAAVYLAEPGALQPMLLTPLEAEQIRAGGVAAGRELLAQKEVYLEPGQWEVLADYYGVRSSIHLPLLGYIDVLERSSYGAAKRVVDFKTSARKGFQVGWALQLLIYAAAEQAQVCEAHLVVRPQTKFDEDGNPVQPKKPGQFRPFIYSFRPTPESFRWAFGWVNAQAAGMRRDAEVSCIDDLPATPCFGCAYCNENSVCEGYLLSKLNPIGGSSEEE